MSYLGKVDMNDANIKHYSLTSSTLTVIPIGWVPASEQSLRVTINGVVQQGDTFSYSGSNLTLGGPLVVTDTLEVVGIQSVGNIITPADNSVTTTRLADDAVTLAKMAGLVRGKIIVGDASGDPSALTVGAVNQVLKSDGTDVSWGADSGGLFASYALLVDSKTTGTNGGTFTLGAWRTRDLQTEVYDGIGISIATNDFTIPAGNYLVRWNAPAFNVRAHQSRLYDVTNTAIIAAGSSEYSRNPEIHAGGNVSNKSFGFARLTPSGDTAYRIEHYCEWTNTTYGFGDATGYGPNELYTMVEIYKES